MIWPIIVVIIAIFFPYNLIGKAIDHTQFIALMAKEARLSNSDIIKQRDQLLTLYHRFLNGKKLTDQQQRSLTRLAKQYKLSKANFSQPATWQLLLQRVDIIPVSLVVAQSINESAWGTSRFAHQGNNYFGQWCYSKGCGIVPKQRAKGAIFEVQRFPNRLASVRSYMLNLNTLHLYNGFRTRRHIIRLSGRPLTGLKLVDALSMYSIRREAYVQSITGLISHFHLANLDQQQTTTSSK
jgi:Bax protein